MFLTAEEITAVRLDHRPRAHKRLPAIQVCAACTEDHGDGDGRDGEYVSHPCAVRRLANYWDATTSLLNDLGEADRLSLIDRLAGALV